MHSHITFAPQDMVAACASGGVLPLQEQRATKMGCSTKNAKWKVRRNCTRTSTHARTHEHARTHGRTNCTSKPPTL